MKLTLAVSAVLLAGGLLAGLVAFSAAAGQEGSPRSGFFALTHAAARDFTVPPDTRIDATFFLDPAGLTYERYQQYYGAAKVLGGQTTVYRDQAGTAIAVIGAHYPGITATNSVKLSRAGAAAIVGQDIGTSESRLGDLMMEPETGVYFYQMESRSLGSRWYHWIDAASGRVLKRYDATDSSQGVGVKGDAKDMSGLTSFHGASGHGATGPHYDLISPDNRQQTFDAQNKTIFAYYVTDDDDTWDLVTANRKSPGQPALVDAHYYANLTDDYLVGEQGLDWIGECGYEAMKSVAHYGNNYNNAFWDGAFIIYGDGNGTTEREYSGSVDVVGHEHTHGVTDCTSALIYQGESGALNESFSDIIGNSIEFFASEPASSNCVKAAGQATCADWWIGEDIDLTTDAVPGFRNMADPEEDFDPDHYSEYVVTSQDSGGVHTNSGIPNHAYYLLVNGGLNASCAQPGTHNSAHCSDGDTQDNNLNVAGIGLAEAERIFFEGFAALPANADMCAARESTEAVAAAFFGSGSQEAVSTTSAWLAVGVTDVACGTVQPSPTPTPTPTPAATPTPTPTPTPGPDADGDGVVDSGDNCPYWPNPDQSLPPWPVPADDADCDGFTGTNEGFVETDPLTACDNGLVLPDWPPDFNDDQVVSIVDVGEMRPLFGSTAGDGIYQARADLSMGGTINIVDVGALRTFFGLNCT